MLPLNAMVGGEDSKVVVDFDASGYGNGKSFEYFSDQFLHQYCKFPPFCNYHVLIVESKLNSGLLIEWAVGKQLNGNKQIFLDPENDLFCKAVVINGGKESEDFIANMFLETPKEEYAECIQILKASHINVFSTLWATGESFQKLFDEIEEIKEQQREIKEQQRENKEQQRENKKRLNVLSEKLEKLEKLQNSGILG